MIIQLATTFLAFAGPLNGAGHDSAAVHTRVDSARREIVITVNSISIPAAEAGGHHGPEVRLPVEWPVKGWMRGWHIDVLDSAGNVLPREMLHHAGVVNLDRRQLAYPVPERLVASGAETKPVLLPASMGVPMTPDQHLVLFYMLTNHTATPVGGATLRVTINYTPDRENGPRNVMPFIVDAFVGQNGGDRSFDLQPGLTETSAEFTIATGGHLRALGAHLHDFAVEIRLEDVATNKVLARLKTKRDSTGKVLSVASTKFLLKWGGLKLKPDHKYRVVGVYDNPTCGVIPQGAMAVLVGVFIPDDMSKWPAVNRLDPLYAEDYAQLVSADERGMGGMNMDDMADMDMHAGTHAPRATCVARK